MDYLSIQLIFCVCFGLLLLGYFFNIVLLFLMLSLFPSVDWSLEVVWCSNTRCGECVHIK